MEASVSKSRKLSRRLLFFSALLIAFLLSVWARAESVSLTWNPNTELDLAGYKLHYGTASNSYSVHIDVHNVTTYTVTGLAAGQTYYFAATAYDTAGNESGYSNQVSHTIPGLNGPPTTPAVPSGASGALVNTTVAFSTSASDPDGDALQYRYDWGGGVLSAWGSAGQAHIWAASGSYDVKAQARDSHGLESSWSGAKTVTISQNTAPSAPSLPSCSASTALVNTVVSFSTSASDPNGDTLQYRYDWGSGLISAWGSASQSKSWSAAGQYSVKAQARDSHGLESAWSGGNTVTISNPAPVVLDSDGDGHADHQDAFPNDPQEWADANGNGIGDNADAAAESADQLPAAPVLLWPVEGEVVSALATLETDAFKAAASGATHAKTRWKVFREDDDVCVLDILSAAALTHLAVPKLVLDEGTAYYWQAQFIDSNAVASEWSVEESFETAVSDADLNANGVPDLQEVDEAVDLDKDGVKDNQQATIKSIKMEGTRVKIGVSIKNCTTALAVESAESEDPQQPDAYASRKPKRMPFGLINFKVAVAHAGDSAAVTLYFSEPAPVRSKWFKYDPIGDQWYDFSANAKFAKDRRSITLALQDGGSGDADGVANGVIVDPAGVVEEPDAEVVSGDSGAASGGGGGGAGGGGGCFISAAAPEAHAGNGIGRSLLIIGLAAAIWQVLRRRPKRERV